MGERSEHSGSDRGCGSEQHHEQRRMMRLMGRAPGVAGRDGFAGSGPQAWGSEFHAFNKRCELCEPPRELPRRGSEQHYERLRVMRLGVPSYQRVG
jgi:hypothetical protein